MLGSVNGFIVPPTMRRAQEGRSEGRPCFCLVRAREPFGLTAGGAALHVNDLSVTHGQHLKPLNSTAVAAGDEPVRRADDLVADLRELGLHLDLPLASFLDLKLENLTGLFGAVSGGRAFPPQMPVRNTAPLRFLRKQRSKRLRVTAIECLGCRAKLVDHRLNPPFWDRTAGRHRSTVPSMSPLMAPFRFVGRMLLRIGRLISGRKRN